MPVRKRTVHSLFCHSEEPQRTNLPIANAMVWIHGIRRPLSLNHLCWFSVRPHGLWGRWRLWSWISSLFVEKQELSAIGPFTQQWSFSENLSRLESKKEEALMRANLHFQCCKLKPQNEASGGTTVHCLLGTSWSKDTAWAFICFLSAILNPRY